MKDQSDPRPDPSAGALAGPPADALDEASVRAIVEHMNDDHADALAACARAFADESTRRRLEGGTGVSVRMTGIDRRGFDILCTGEPDGSRAGEGAGRHADERVARIEFPEPLVSAADARRALVALTRQARQRLEPDG